MRDIIVHALPPHHGLLRTTPALRSQPPPTRGSSMESKTHMITASAEQPTVIVERPTPAETVRRFADMSATVITQGKATGTPKAHRGLTGCYYLRGQSAFSLCRLPPRSDSATGLVMLRHANRRHIMQRKDVFNVGE
ncbi:hypothetical protein D3C86_1040510 [compost metagenome]